MNSLLLSTLLAVAITTTYGLKCYDCEGGDSYVKPGDCGDTFDKKANKDILVMCNATAGETFCRKQKSGVNHVYTETTRGCAKQCEERNVAFVDRVTCCETDGCNSGNGVRPAAIVLFVSSALLFTYKSFM